MCAGDVAPATLAHASSFDTPARGAFVFVFVFVFVFGSISGRFILSCRFVVDM